MNRSIKARAGGFTLIELMVATVILLGISALMINATGQAGQVFKRTSGKIEQFGEARRAFENVTRSLSEATLNTYWDYSYKMVGTSRVPAAYVRQSELRFRSGAMRELIPSKEVYRPTHGVFFQAPAGLVEDQEALHTLDQTLNTWGFFVEVGDDRDLRPQFLGHRVPTRLRSRLMELREPTERLSIYTPPSGGSTNWWFADSINQSSHRPVRVLAENIVAFVVLPRLAQPDELARGGKPPLSPNYEYDSTRTSNEKPPKPTVDPEVNPKNQLPPVVQIVMVAIDEISGARLAEEHGDDEDLGIQTDGLFADSRRLEDNPSTPDRADGDLHELENRLNRKRLAFRTFSSSVALRGAKWSKAQTN